MGFRFIIMMRSLAMSQCEGGPEVGCFILKASIQTG